MDILASRTLLHPADFDRTLTFYRDGLGLAVAREFGSGDHRGVVFFAGGGFLEVVGTGPGPGRPGIELWLQVRSMDATVAELDARGITGKGVTPFLLAHFASASRGTSVSVNTALVLSNAAFAGGTATAFAQVGTRTEQT